MKKAFRIMTTATVMTLLLSGMPVQASEDAAASGQETDNNANGFVKTSSPAVTDNSNLFWSIYGVAEHPDPDIKGNRYGDNTAWTEWDALKFAWTGSKDYRTHVKQSLNRAVKINGYNATGSQPDGYIWSWGISEAWPDGSYHYDQNPRFINAVYNIYMWTKDDDYLNKMLPKAELVMDSYLLNHEQGGSGVLTIPNTANNGTTNGDPSNYWDQARYGYQDAWTNEAFYTALKSMAELELAQGKTVKAQQYETLAAAFPARYNSAFWNNSTNRYSGWKDVNGTAHDFGFTFINMEALARGLGDENKAQQIYEWIDGGNAEPTVGGAHPGSTDVYQLVVAPRTNTVNIPNAYSDPWSDPPTGPRPYGEGLPNGGAAMWTSYYDIMARLQYLGADNAFARYDAMLSRVASDSKFLTFNPASGRFYNDFGESLVEIGSNDPFPETGIAMLPYVYGFIGAKADLAGFHLTPDLPTALLYAEAAQMNYAGHPMTVKVSRGEQVIENEAYNAAIAVNANSTATQGFTAAAPFNEIGVYLKPHATGEATVAVGLEKLAGGVWQQISSRSVAYVNREEWVYMAVPEQEQGATYRIRISATSGSGAFSWFVQQNGATDGAAFLNNQPVNGSFGFRVIHSAQSTVLQQTQFDTSDSNNQILGQSFISGVPFNRVGIMIDTPAGGSGEFTLTLYKKLNGKWTKRTQQIYQNAQGVQSGRNSQGGQGGQGGQGSRGGQGGQGSQGGQGGRSGNAGSGTSSEVVLNFSTEQPGEYKLELSRQQGTVGWLRNSQSAAADGFEASTDGALAAGKRWFKVYRDQYHIVIPELQVDAVVAAGDTYSITNLTPIITPDPVLSIPEPLTAGNSLGQSFASSEAFNTLILNTPTWTNTDSRYTVTLKKTGPAGEALFTKEIVNVIDGNNTIQVGLQQPGSYYVEISNPYKSVGWWTVDDTRSDGTAFQNGSPILDQDRLMEVKLVP
ncbi:hypothetical protein [Paenibacillus sp. GCM10027626]|uniref:hypothetical protein n=1 Tax=Paenibacillus sp. GCM10027626 TaxID=3273411 RepID=UPI00364206BA